MFAQAPVASAAAADSKSRNCLSVQGTASPDCQLTRPGALLTTTACLLLLSRGCSRALVQLRGVRLAHERRHFNRPHQAAAHAHFKNKAQRDEPVPARALLMRITLYIGSNRDRGDQRRTRRRAALCARCHSPLRVRMSLSCLSYRLPSARRCSI